jgi:large subunit ribosomal protein L17e
LNVGSNFRCHLQITNHPIIANEQCSLQVRYAAQEISQAKSARARGSYLRVSFKNTRETAQAINGMKLSKALTFLENVTTKTMAVPMRRYAGSTGRTAQGESPFFSFKKK